MGGRWNAGPPRYEPLMYLEVVNFVLELLEHFW